MFILDLLMLRRAEMTPLKIMQQLIPRKKYILFMRKGNIYAVTPRAGLRPLLKQKLERPRFSKKIVKANASLKNAVVA
jgi:hypothetical protein